MQQLEELKMPYNKAAEEAILGSIFLDPELIHQAAIDLRPDDFFAESCKVTFAAMMTLNRQNRIADFPAVNDFLAANRDLERIGGGARLAEFIDNCYYAGGFESCITALKAASMRRRYLHASAEIENLAADPTITTEELQTKAENVLFACNQQQRGGFKLFGEIVSNRLAELEQANKIDSTGIQSGFPHLDSIIGGWRPGQFITIGARPGAGKSAFALALALNAAAQGYTVGKFSLEMSSSEIADRAISSLSEINSRTLRSGWLNSESIEKLIAVENHAQTYPLYVDDTADLSIAEMRSKARQLKTTKGLDLLIVDYLQLMEGDSGNNSRYDKVSKISRELKKLAKDLGIALIALSQLSRKVEERQDHRPQLSDIRESGCIEQDSDLVLFLYRPDLYPSCPEEEKGISEIIIAKHRNGALANIKLGFRPEVSRFETIAQGGY